MIHKRKRTLWIKERTTIGIGGLYHGCGVTHTCMMLEKYFTGCRRESSAYIELCSSSPRRRYEESCCDRNRMDRDAFITAKVPSYRNITAKQLPEIYRSGYENYIVDFGVLNSIEQEYLRCDIRILILDTAFWRKQIAVTWLEQNKDTILKEVIPLVLFGSEREVNRWRKEYGHVFYGIPFNHDARNLSIPVVELFHSIFI